MFLVFVTHVHAISRAARVSARRLLLSPPAQAAYCTNTGYYIYSIYAGAAGAFTVPVPATRM